MLCTKKIELAKSRLATEIDRPFYYGIVYRRPIIWADPRVKTAAMDALGNMYMCKEFVDRLTIDMCVFLLAHEALHFMLRHCDRRGERDPKQWNIAADKVINDMLVFDEVGTPIPEGIYLANAREKTADQLYIDPATAEKGGQPKSTPGIGDDIIEVPMDEEQKAQVEAELTQDVLTASKMAKMRGVEPGGLLGELIKDILTKPVPWYDVVLDYMTSTFPDTQDWSRPNKKYWHLGIYMPVVQKKPRLEHALIIFDTSISVTHKECEMYVDHVNVIFDLLPPNMVTLVQGGCEVRHHQSYTIDELPITLEKLHKGGGTSFEPILNWCEEELPPVDICIYFTDLESTTDFEPPSFPVIWASTNRTNNKFGTLVEIHKA
jgi:predicted metal-dependent peptidase